MWNDISSADTYFETRYAASAWANLSDPDKTSLLTTSYNRIFNNSNYDIPSSPSSEQLVILKLAENEMAWYMYIHLGDEDRRIGLQSQGVTEAGIVKEKYKDPMAIPFPPIVTDILDGLSNLTVFYASSLYRDENQNVDGDDYV